MSTEKAQSDLLELTHEELEVDDTGESVDGNEKLLSDVDWGKSMKISNPLHSHLSERKSY